MENAIQIFAILHLTIIGISHIAQPEAWVRFFLWLREKGEAGVFASAFLYLTFGSIIASFHQVWTGIPLALTLLGWGQIIKATLYFIWPSYGLRQFRMVSLERAHVFRWPGYFFLIFATALGWHVAQVA